MSEQITVVGKGRALLALVLVLPYVLGAALYLSVIFALFSAIPIIYSSLRFGRVSGILCGVANMALVWLVAGQRNAAVFFVIGAVLGITLAEGLKQKLKLEWNVLLVSGMMLLVSSALVFSYSKKFNVNPIERIDSFVGEVVDKVAHDIEIYKASNKVSNQDLDKFLVDPQMTKRNILTEMPNFLGILLLLLAVINLLLVLRLNPVNVRESLSLGSEFFTSWKVPEFLVWPTIICGFCLVVEMPYVSLPALNLFKILMAVYAIQGLAIMAFLFHSFKVPGFLRPLGYVIAVLVLLPLVISLGFFDLWFLFREKLVKK